MSVHFPCSISLLSSLHSWSTPMAKCIALSWHRDSCMAWTPCCSCASVFGMLLAKCTVAHSGVQPPETVLKPLLSAQTCANKQFLQAHAGGHLQGGCSGC